MAEEISGAAWPTHTARPSRRNLSDDVCSYVRDLIISGKVRAGDFLRIEAIAREVGVSITPVREGLLALSREGFVDVKPRRGFVVAPLSARDLADIFELQAYISGELAARAAAERDDDYVVRLRAQYEAHHAAWQTDDTEAIERANHEFHRLVHGASGSRKLVWVLGSLSRYVPRRFYGSVTSWQHTREPHPVDYHRQILAAVEEGDAARARTVMRDHVLRAGETLAQHLRSVGVLTDDRADETS